MNKHYRIKEYDFMGDCTYVVEKKSIFGFWYNPDNVDAYTTGVYDTINNAQRAIIRKMNKPKIRIVPFDFNE